MKNKLLLMMMLLLGLFGVARADEVVIGDGTSTTNYAPIGTYYNYSITEQLYTAEEIGMAGTINSISFYYASSTAKTFPIEVYMLNVDAADLSTGISLAEAELVFEGDYVVTGQGWFTINLDTPFVYDGESNLLIGINKDYVQWYSGGNWQGTSIANMTRYSQQDSSGYTVSTTPGSGLGTRPNITINITQGSVAVCEKPDEIEVSNITANSALITWSGGSGTYNLQYKTEEVSEWTDLLTNATVTSHLMTGLSSMTAYSVRVQSVCDDATSGWKSASFIVPASIPLVEEFGATIPSGWAMYSGLLGEDGTAQLSASSYAWAFGPGNNVFDDHARVNIYGTTSYKWLVMPPILMENNVELTFNMALTVYTSGSSDSPTPGNQADDKFIVLVSTDGGEVWEVLRQWDNAGSEYVYDEITNTGDDFVSINLSNYAGQSVLIAFYGESTITGGDNNLHIDDVSVDYISSCEKPRALTVGAIGGHTAELSWISDASNWQICFNGDENNLINIQTNPYTLTGLDPETEYTVKMRTNCLSDGFSNWSNEVTFTTDVACPNPTNLTASDITAYTASVSWDAVGASGFELQYCETVGNLGNNFEDGTLGDWTTIDADEDGNTWVPSTDPGIYHNAGVDLSGNGHNGSQHFALSGSYANQTGAALTPDNYLVSPEINLGGSISFWACAQDASYPSEHFGVAVSTLSNDDPADFETIAEWTLTAKGVGNPVNSGMTRSGNRTVGAWYQFTVDLSQYSGQGYVAIRHFNCTDMFILNVDDISITDPTLTPTWIPVSNPTSPCTLSNLIPETNYTVRVRSNCGTDGYSEWVYADFSTVASCLPPENLACTAFTQNSATLSWTDENGASSWTLQYGTDETFATYDQITIQTNPYTLTGLTPETTYYARIMTNCADGESEWSNICTFEPTAKVVIGTPATTNSYLPTYTYYNYSFTEQIYTAQEIGAAGTILSLDFFNTGVNRIRTLEIYMVSTTKTSFTSTTDWIDATEDDLVYSGEVGFATGVWTSIEFDTPFDYDGQSNVALVVNDITGSYESSVPFYAFEATSQAIRIYNDNNSYDPEDHSNYSGTPAVLDVKNHIRLLLGEPPTCPKPKNVAVDEVQTREATLSWTPGGDENMWRIAYSTDSDIDPEDAEYFVDVRSNPATIDENLVPDQTYYAWVRATCSDEDFSDWSTMVTFTTLEACPKPTDVTISNLMPTSATVNWTSQNDNFQVQYAPITISDEYEDGYGTDTYVTGIGTNGGQFQWGIMFPAGSYDGNGIVKVSVYDDMAMTGTLYIYNDGDDAPSNVVASIPVEFTGAGEFIDFNFMAVLNDTKNAWVVFDNESMATYPAAACEDPYDDPNGRWVGLGGEWSDLADAVPGYSWMIKAEFANISMGQWVSANTTTNSYDMTDLTPETLYAVQVRSYCGTDGYSSWVETSFSTPSACQVPTRLTVEPGTTEATLSWTGYQTAYNIEYWIPAHVDVTVFDQEGNDFTAADTLTLYNFDLSGFSGTGSIAIRHYNVTDMFRLNIDDIVLTVPGGEEYLNIDFEDGEIPSDWINYDADGDGNVWDIWSITQVDGNGNPVGNGSYCATSASYNSTGALTPDNWLIIPNVPLGGTFSFVARGQDPSYAAEVFGVYVTPDDAIVPASDPEFIEAVTDNPFVLDNLEPETTYEVHIQGVCSKNEFTDWTNTVTFTTLSSCETPDDVAVTEVTANSAVVAWTGYQDTYNVQYWQPEGFNDGAFEQVGTDVTVDGTLTEYTFDLSNYTGIGSVAIRHYNITDMFRLLIDDVVLTNAAGDEIINADFEDEIPENLIIYDADGDGYNWGYLDYSSNSDYEPGTYFDGYAGLYSASYDNNYGPLYPDNWLVFTDVELGGTLTLLARGQDPSYAGEVFGVFVTTESYLTEATEPVVIEDVTSPYTIEDLDPSTIYAVEVQGQCDDDVLTGWSETYYFITESSCPAPEMPTFSDITANSVVISWVENGNATSWQIEVINYTQTQGYAAGTGDFITVDTNPYTLTGLMPESTYVIYVYSICGPGETSTFSDWNYFETLEEEVTEEEQTVTLTSGWGWFSSYVEYPENALELIANSIAETSTTATIKSQNDGYLSLENETWTGTLSTLYNEQMYLISCDGGEISLTAPLADPNDHPITLGSGWNWIGYISGVTMEVNTALANLNPATDDMIKGQGGFASYGSEGWTGSLTALEPGAGYIYLNNGEETTLVYAISNKGYVGNVPAPTHWNTNHYLFPTNLTMMVTLDAEQYAMTEGSHEIAAFVNGECRGTSLLQKVQDRYIGFLTVSGNQGEEVSFRLFDVNGNVEYAGIADEQIIYRADDIYGSLKNPMTLHFRNTGVNEYNEVSLFPNPTSGKVMIQGQAIETVNVYNAMGQLLISEVVGNAEQVELNLGSLSAGVYTINVVMTNGQQSNRMVVKE